jgi:hypothetical protein
MKALRSFLVLAVSCATQGGGSSGVSNVPSAGDGPFRPLVSAELSVYSLPPYVFSNSSAMYREPSVVGTSSDPTSAQVWMYAVATSKGADVIVRTSADDARSFYADVGDTHTYPQHVPAVVLTADQAWEGEDLSGPSALLTGGQVYLYYSAAGGIGLAMATDGLTFMKVAGPVLAPDPTMAWETSGPHAPTVAIFPDGSWHMLYGAGDSIGEATSSDGQTWTRVASNPVLSPSPTVDPSTLAPGVQPPFDEGRVDHPVMSPQTDIDGRLQVRVLYAGYGPAPGADAGTSLPASAIGLAGRYGTSGPLSRQAVPVYTVGLHEAAPAFFEYSGGSLLYVQEDNPALSETMPYTAIAAAYAPADGSLPPPMAYPSSP